MPESIIKGVLKYSVSTWINMAVGFISVILTTRLMSPELYGQVAIFISATSVLQYIMTFGMDGALIRFYNEPPASDTKNQMLYKCILISSIVCITLGLGATLIAGEKLSSQILHIGSRFLFGILVVNTFCNIILRYLNISFRMSFQARKYTVQNVLINCLSRVILIIAAIFTDNFVYISLALTLGIFSVTSVYTFSQRGEIIPYDNQNRINISPSLKGYTEFLRFAVYSAPTYIVFYLNDYLNKQIIESYIGNYALGIFSSSAIFGSILTGLKGGFGTYWSAFVYKNYESEKSRITNMHDYIVLGSILAASLLICFRDIIYLIIGPEFHESKKFFSLLLAMPFLTFVLETTDKGIALAKRNQISLVNHTISVVVHIGLCLFLTKMYGLLGAAVANAISAIILYFLNTFFGQKYYNSIPKPSRSIIGIFILISVLASAAVFNSILIIVGCVVTLDLVSIAIYRKQVVRVLNYLVQFVKSKI